LFDSWLGFCGETVWAEDLVDKIQKAYRRKTEHNERIRKAEIDKIIKRRGW